MESDEEHEMQALTRTDLMSLEEYEQVRPQFRQRIKNHKKSRIVALGEHVTLHFEDRLTMQYQLQEILRIEKIFQADAIEAELAVYNPMIPDGVNWKATMMIEYSDVDVRKAKLSQLVGIDLLTWVRIGDHKKVFAISDEDLQRTTEDKTSAVHFLRFELDQESISAAVDNMPISAGCDHHNYTCEVVLPEGARASLLFDLSG